MRLRLFLSCLVSRPSPSSFLCCVFCCFVGNTLTRLEARPVISRRPVRVIVPAPSQVLARGGPRGRRVGPLQVTRRVAYSLVLRERSMPQRQLKRFVSFRDNAVSYGVRGLVFSSGALGGGFVRPVGCWRFSSSSFFYPLSSVFCWCAQAVECLWARVAAEEA